MRLRYSLEDFVTDTEESRGVRQKSDFCQVSSWIEVEIHHSLFVIVRRKRQSRSCPTSQDPAPWRDPKSGRFRRRAGFQRAEPASLHT